MEVERGISFEDVFFALLCQHADSMHSDESEFRVLMCEHLENESNVGLELIDVGDILSELGQYSYSCIVVGPLIH